MSDLIDRINTELATINHSNNATSAHDLLDECKSSITELEIKVSAKKDALKSSLGTVKIYKKRITKLKAECEELKRANTAHVALSILTARASKDNDNE